MRLVVQRVLRAKLTSQGQTVSEIQNGLMVLCGITHSDTQVDVDSLVPKLLKLKLWGTEEAMWKHSVVEKGYQILFVSQFTLYHQFKGTKPDFHDAADHEVAKSIYNSILTQLQKEYLQARATAKVESPDLENWVQPGAFGQYMNIEQVCDGPVTLVLDSVRDPKAVKKYEANLARQAKADAKLMAKQKG